MRLPHRLQGQKVKSQGHGGGGILWRPPSRTACFLLRSTAMNLLPINLKECHSLEQFKRLLKTFLLSAPWGHGALWHLLKVAPSTYLLTYLLTYLHTYESLRMVLPVCMTGICLALSCATAQLSYTVTPSNASNLVNVGLRVFQYRVSQGLQSSQVTETPNPNANCNWHENVLRENLATENTT